MHFHVASEVIPIQHRHNHEVGTIGDPSPKRAQPHQRHLQNGVLTLTIPIAEEAKPRRVAITNAGDVVEAVTAGSVAE